MVAELHLSSLQIKMNSSLECLIGCIMLPRILPFTNLNKWWSEGPMHTLYSVWGEVPSHSSESSPNTEISNVGPGVAILQDYFFLSWIYHIVHNEDSRAS